MAQTLWKTQFQKNFVTIFSENSEMTKQNEQNTVSFILVVVKSPRETIFTFKHMQGKLIQ